tara:strand:+ start:1141 stop:1407 length:267 start_codon:yes stop_codon:yes gene_type:complete
VTTKTQTCSSFDKQLRQYNIQEKINNYRIKQIIKKINQECKLPSNNYQNKCLDFYIQLQDEYDNVRLVKNLKHDLYNEHGLHWDEEYY